MRNSLRPSLRIAVSLLFGVALATTTCQSLHAAEPATIDIAKARVEKNVAWYDVRQLGVEGQGWSDTAAPFDRFPAKAQKTVRGSVWNLSRHSAGLCVRFVTDSPEIHAKWTLTSPNLAMNHMPATGVSGLDLYVKTESGKWRWLAVGRPTEQTNQVRLVGSIPKGTREYMLYLPLYNGVKEVEVGLPKIAVLKKASPRKSGLKPIVFYGTSITQGGCASRPGMVYTAFTGGGSTLLLSTLASREMEGWSPKWPN